jgi:hypothetical protein
MAENRPQSPTGKPRESFLYIATSPANKRAWSKASARERPETQGMGGKTPKRGGKKEFMKTDCDLTFSVMQRDEKFTDSTEIARFMVKNHAFQFIEKIAPHKIHRRFYFVADIRTGTFVHED